MSSTISFYSVLGKVNGLGGHVDYSKSRDVRIDRCVAPLPEELKDYDRIIYVALRERGLDLTTQDIDSNGFGKDSMGNGLNELTKCYKRVYELLLGEARVISSFVARGHFTLDLMNLRDGKRTLVKADKSFKCLDSVVLNYPESERRLIHG